MFIWNGTLNRSFRINSRVGSSLLSHTNLCVAVYSGYSVLTCCRCRNNAHLVKTSQYSESGKSENFKGHRPTDWTFSVSPSGKWCGFYLSFRRQFLRPYCFSDCHWIPGSNSPKARRRTRPYIEITWIVGRGEGPVGSICFTQLIYFQTFMFGRGGNFVRMKGSVGGLLENYGPLVRLSKELWHLWYLFCS